MQPSRRSYHRLLIFLFISLFIFGTRLLVIHAQNDTQESTEESSDWREEYPMPTVPLESGTKDESVFWLQHALNDAMDAGLGYDGSFGPATTNAVKKFQEQNGLEVSGNIDAPTLQLLYELTKKEDVQEEEIIEEIAEEKEVTVFLETEKQAALATYFREFFNEAKDIANFKTKIVALYTIAKNTAKSIFFSVIALLTVICFILLLIENETAYRGSETIGNTTYMYYGEPAFHTSEVIESAADTAIRHNALEWVFIIAPMVANYCIFRQCFEFTFLNSLWRAIVYSLLTVLLCMIPLLIFAVPAVFFFKRKILTIIVSLPGILITYYLWIIVPIFMWMRLC